MHVQAVGSRRQVFNGTAHHTTGGLEKKDLKLNPDGEIVSKAKSKLGKKNPWIKAFVKAKKDEGITKKSMAFPEKGSDLYKAAKKIYSK